MHFQISGLSLQQFNLPEIPLDAFELDDNDEDRQADAEYALANVEKLNEMQRYMYDVIMQNVEEVQAGVTSQCRAYFLDGPGGSGKTMLYNTLISALRARNHKVFINKIYCLFK